MFAEKNDEEIRSNNDSVEAESSRTVIKESKLKKAGVIVSDTVGFASGFIIAVVGATLVFELALASTGLSVFMTLLAFLTLNIICILCGSKLKTNSWVPQMGGQYV